MDSRCKPALRAVRGQHVIASPGTGKTHLATAIGVAGITRHGKRVRFYSTVDLVNALEQEKAQGRAGRIANSLLRMDLVILDELGYLPFSQAGGALLFHLLSRLYGKRGLDTLLTRSAPQTSTTGRRSANATRQVVPSPGSMVAVRWLMGTTAPTTV